MTQVEFEDQKYRQYPGSRESSLSDMLVKRGVMKNRQRAHTTLAIFAVLMFSFAFYLTFWPALQARFSSKTLYVEDIPELVRENLTQEILNDIPSRDE